MALLTVPGTIESSCAYPPPVRPMMARVSGGDEHKGVFMRKNRLSLWYM